MAEPEAEAVVEDATVVEEPSTDLEVAVPRNEVIRPLPLQETREAMQQYQAGLKSLLVADDYQSAGAGRKFVKKSGWRKIATWFNLSVVVVRESVDRDHEGNPVRASVVARAIAPNGRTMDGDGHCDVHESRFKDAKGREKLENDLRGTATTRAKNRAIADLVGMGAVSAEEVGDAPALATASKALLQTTERALAYLLDGDMDAVSALLEAIRKETAEGKDGKLPTIVAKAIVIVAKTVRETQKGESDAKTPES